jgi:hypothetical protein
MAFGMTCERIEEDRLVRHGEIVVAELAVGALRDRPEFGANGLIGFERRRAAVGDETGELSRGVESGAGVVDVIDVVMQHVPRGLAHPAAGQHVEADVQDAVGREALGSEGEQRVRDGRRHPRIHAMRDDEVELSVRRRERRQVLFDERDVVEAERADRAPSFFDRRRERSQPTKRACGSETAIETRFAPLLQPTSSTAAALDRGRGMPDDRPRPSPTGRVRRAMRQRVVGDLVVAIARAQVGGVGRVRHGMREGDSAAEAARVFYISA